MRFDEKEITLKDGRKCIFKPCTPEYSADMIEYMKKTAGETEYLLRYPDEIDYTLESEQKMLSDILENPDSLMMVALVDGKVAGNSSINGMGPKRKLNHRCTLSIALYEEFWGLGIGTALIEYMTELSVKHGWKQMDLEVVADNERAKALYKKCGFIESGRRHNALLFDDGTYHDEILMYKPL